VLAPCSSNLNSIVVCAPNRFKIPGAVRSWFACDFLPKRLPDFWLPLRVAEYYSRAVDAPVRKNRKIKIAARALWNRQQKQGGQISMKGQLGHRDEDIELKDADSNLAG